ncbi:F-box-like protein [Ceratobasidium sp. AG-Ba]|nr:F-box-like protein [Ceratobasidium sp. AG-Ba]QRW04679.1 F-box-like protein [Ceratobasidium sp. AG-Ba]
MQEFCQATSSLTDAFTSPGQLSHEMKDIAKAIHQRTEWIIKTRKQLISSSAALLEIRNLHATSINQLPVDILKRIFRIVVDSSQTTSSFMKPAARISSVCHLWRDAALSTSTIWGYVTVDQVNKTLEAAKLCLERSSKSPLHVTIRDVGTSFETALYHRDVASHILYAHAPRFTTFNLEVQHATTLDSLIDIWLEYGTPGAVKNLSIVSHQANFDPYDVLDNPHIPHPFLEPIRTLHLENVYVHWKSPLFHNLVELSLNADQAQASVRPSVLELADMLRMSPRLEVLKLLYLNLQPGSAPLSSQVELCKLHTFSIGASSSQVVSDLLSVIAWPLSNSIHLHLDPGYHKRRPHLSELTATWDTSYASSLRVGDPISSSTLDAVVPRLSNTSTFIYYGRVLDRVMLEKITSLAQRGLRFRTIEIATCIIENQEAFRQMVTSHRVECLNLTQCDFLKDEGVRCSSRIDANMDLPICTWLEESVGAFDIFGYGKHSLWNDSFA